MADSFNKKEREKKKRKKKKEKQERREQKKLEDKKPAEFMYVDENGHLTPTPPDPAKKKKIKAEDIVIGVPSQEKSDESSFQRSGTVKFFDTDKGYGFIIDNANQESYFAHANNLIDEIKEADQVSFEIGSGPKGPVALSVKLLADTEDGEEKGEDQS